MVKAFAKVLTPQEAQVAYARVYRPRPPATEVVPLMEAFGRVLAADVRATEDLPPFDRSTVDGYAIRATDTGAPPATLTVVGEVLMGHAAPFDLGPGQAVRVPTGGMLPPGADAVVMQEKIEYPDPRTIRVPRPVKPGENVIARAEDVRAGEVVLEAGVRLRPQEVALLAGLGHTAALVHARPRAAILVTGDEIVPPDRAPGPGQVRDMNTYSLAGLVSALGGVPRPYGIIEDRLEVFLAVLREAHRDADLVLISGGSSVGDRDLVADAITALGAPGIVVHGVAIKPGKPTVLAVVEGKPVIGLPGHPVSSMVVFDVFVRPILAGLMGLRARERPNRRIRARLAQPIPSEGRREDHIRVAVDVRDGVTCAVPILGKSGVITTMVRADGIVVVPIGVEWLEAGAEVEVEVFD
ncbi:MAG: molybdopterin molybdotransferase MoeA [Armatimonadetes bacterium]|nr:molybdopterin molybdotransferase MoeA [Armatimonadota bacterium]